MKFNILKFLDFKFHIIFFLKEFIKIEIGEMNSLDQPHIEWRVPFYIYHVLLTRFG
ncbi:MAG: hypothetical protein JW390_70011 [Nitrosopumilus sp.]|nr:hypothetical protein [Candidatus Nitrosopumilus limneticus]